MLNHFEILPFILGLFVGVIGLLFIKDKAHIIYKYPHPSNVNDLAYKDPNGVCYRYSSAEVDCDKNEGSLKTYPIQEGMPNYE
jgi:hypothetical protein